ncbi:E3 ubiquitin-protein ligase UBR2 [Liparis tanakae]|uniref:E3 ubiquitin-protein ligase n=1 Tax=Liparis tanakae TaxID=230148 RepID=A0A4Z2E7R5_9TELE|nr:E3 ubiquitin-protein ligase UBR2 [Liparis tanakae]
MVMMMMVMMMMIMMMMVDQSDDDDDGDGDDDGWSPLVDQIDDGDDDDDDDDDDGWSPLDPVSVLPADMAARAFSIFSILLKYSVDMLTWSQEDQLPAGLEPLGPFVSRQREDSYYCMLFNDEVHTYEQVIYTLQKAVSCSQKEAVSFATTVDRDVSTPYSTRSIDLSLSMYM